ncbi:MAG TPA: hypothetical protein VG164_15870 [Trebonia sp.]|nr:hypothetical protein [Trebonia sp.]
MAQGITFRAVTDKPVAFTHSCGHDLEYAPVCRQCGAEVTPDEVEMRVLAPGWTRQGPA